MEFDAIYYIETVLPTLNQYIDAERANKYIASSLKKKFTKICSEYALAIKNKIDPNGLYDIYIIYNVEDNRTDSDNLYHGMKYVLDGLVVSGVLAKDGRKNVRHILNYVFTVEKYIIKVCLKKVE